MASLGLKAQIELNLQVVDASTQMPIPEAQITWLESDFPQTTNDWGIAQFSLSKAGTYTFQVDAQGYNRLVKEIVVGNENPVIQLKIEPYITVLKAVEVRALRANNETPVAYTNLNKSNIEAQNSGRDIPFLLEQTPSVVATSDAGAGIGYTNIRVRGSDITRINVTVNGVPINDAESNSVFWVNMPDLASSTSSIQLQRGVGTSTNGASAFGASLNMQTDDVQKQASAQLHTGFGSFNTQRYTAQFNTGLLQKHWWFNGRMSKITSDGYIDRARSNLQSYYLSGGYIGEKSTLRAVVFGGKEITYQAWYGVDSNTLVQNRTTNFAGAIYNDAWEIVDYYDNQVDNYAQDHYQLHFNHRLAKNWQLGLSGHYTYGRGYYEEYQQDAYMPDYKMMPLIVGSDTISTTDLVRQKWLDNDFFGVIFNLAYSGARLTSTLGGAINQYEGRHFGDVIWAQQAADIKPNHEFYRSFSTKTDANVYLKNLYRFDHKTQVFLDVQLRSVNYSAKGLDDDVGDFNFAQNNVFFNPKVGFNYNINSNLRFFASYAIANREPNRTDLIYADPNDLPKPENLQDIELGLSKVSGKFTWEANLFYMYYKNQLVLTGQLDAVGYPIRANIGKSYRMGIELAGTWQANNWLIWQPTITYMQSQNLSFISEDENGNVEALSNTAIAYAPNVIAASTLRIKPNQNLSVSLVNKYVGAQYLNNTQKAKFLLHEYFLTDIRIGYSLNFNGLKMRLYGTALNLLNAKYSSNGYVYGQTPYYYPQAGINFLGGIIVDL